MGELSHPGASENENAEARPDKVPSVKPTTINKIRVATPRSSDTLPNTATNGVGDHDGTTAKATHIVGSCSSVERRLLHDVVVHAAAAYVTWVLLGTVAFVSHLGKQAPLLAHWLPASGQYGRDDAYEALGLMSFLRINIPYALMFVLPHSVLRPTRLSALLARVSLQRYSRLAYNVFSACSLHHFMWAAIPLRTPIVMTTPLSHCVHLSLSAGCLLFAAICFVTDMGTPTLLGISHILPQHQVQQLPRGMDAITWMGECVWRKGGPVAFVLFTGVSIVPPELTLGDAIVRVCAALYLRARSVGFSKWLTRIDVAHRLTWVIRAAMLTVALLSASSASVAEVVLDWRFASALALAGALRVAEHYARKAFST